MVNRDRKTYLGGTAAATIMLGERYGTTSADLCRWYQNQIEFASLEDNPHIKRGQILEDVVIEQLKQAGWVITDEQRHCYGSSVGLGEYLGGTIDGICKPPQGPPGVLEVKCPASRNYFRWIDHGVPQGHVWQTRLYMAMTGFEVAYIVAFNADEFEYHVFQVDRCDKLEKQLLDTMGAFWQTVQAGGVWDLMPMSDAPVIGAESVEGDADMQALMSEYSRVKSDADFYTERAKQLRKRIQDNWPNDCRRLVTAAGTASFTQPKPSTRVDTNKLRAQYPDIYEQVVVVQRRSPFLTVRTAGVEEKHMERRMDAIERAKREAAGRLAEIKEVYGKSEDRD